MNKNMYTIKDTKTEIFSPPFLAHTHGEAERIVQETASQGQSTLAKYPEHFDLYHLGSFSDHDGQMKLTDSPQFMIKVQQLVKPVQ